MPAIEIEVVAGILIDRHDQILITERLASASHMAGYWEFPGGKIERGEHEFDALQRELDEEIGIELIAAKPFMKLSHDYPEKMVHLSFWTVSAWRGEPSSKEGQGIRWVERADLKEADLLPADQAVIQRLRGRSSTQA